MKCFIALLITFSFGTMVTAGQLQPTGLSGLTAGGTELYSPDGGVRYCDPETNRARLNKNYAKAVHKTMRVFNVSQSQAIGMMVQVTAKQANLAIINMLPMGKKNEHSRAVLNGKQVWACVPHPSEIIYAIKLKGGKYYPLLVRECGNLIEGADYFASKQAAKKVRRMEMSGDSLQSESQPGGGNDHSEPAAPALATNRDNPVVNTPPLSRDNPVVATKAAPSQSKPTGKTGGRTNAVVKTK